MTERTNPRGSSDTDVLDELLVAAGQADTTSFVELYDRLVPRVYGLARSVLGDAHQAEEIAHEVFLEVWRTADGFDPAGGSASAWALTMTHRRAVERLRSWTAGVRRDATRPVEALDANRRSSDVQAALGALPPAQQRAVELAYFGGCTHTEVSRLMDAPLGTSKTRIRDALCRLRDAMVTPAAEPA